MYYRYGCVLVTWYKVLIYIVIRHVDEVVNVGGKLAIKF